MKINPWMAWLFFFVWLAIVLAATTVMLTVFTPRAHAQETSLPYDFRRAKDLVKSYIEDASTSAASDTLTPSIMCSSFAAILSKNLDDLGAIFPVTKTIRCGSPNEISNKFNLDIDLSVGSAAFVHVEYKDLRGSIAWDFDVVFTPEQEKPFFFEETGNFRPTDDDR